MMQTRQKNAYDPSLGGRNAYDPSLTGRRSGFNNATGPAPAAAGSQVVVAAQGQKMQVNVTINNRAAIDLQMELWNWLTSVTRVQNPVYNQGVYHFIPLLTFEGLLAIKAGTGGEVGFNAVGNLEMHGDDTIPSPIPTIGCQEVAYSAFFEASSIAPFQVSSLRITYSSSAQIANNIQWFQKTFSGLTTSNPVNPQSYFSPQQFQDLILDIPIQFTIGLDSGLNLKVITGNTLTIALFIEMWTVQGIGAA